MSDEKIRAEFEAWLPAIHSRERCTRNGYNKPYVALAWAAWQASRASLCVELPKSVNEEASFPGSIVTASYNGLLCACKEALDKAGVKYK